MTLLRRLNKRLKGWRIYLVAVAIASPDILNGLAGIDFTALLPSGWATRAGAIVAIARVVAIPVLMQLRRAARDDDKGAA